MSKPKNTIAPTLTMMFEAFYGRWSERRRHAAMINSLPTIRDAIDNIGKRWDVNSSINEYKPIFIFSAGWRSGSTLLQRLILSDENILIWGEPYAHCDLIRKLANSLRAFQKDVPRDQFFIDHYLSEDQNDPKLSNLWVANLYPMPNDLIEAHRQFFLALFHTPAQREGFSRWGFKEVRLSADYAWYLKFLFPEAKFLFLYRNPYNAYRSYKTFRAWYDEWPTSPVFTARQYGRVWRNLLESFFDASREIGGVLVKFEDLATANIDINALAEYLDVQIQKNTIENTITGQRMEKPETLSFLEKKLLESVVEPLAGQLGYTPDK